MPALLPWWQSLKPVRLLNWLLPAHCALCLNACDGQLCPLCQARYFSRPLTRCPQCGLAGPAGVCGQCLVHPPAFDATMVATDYLAPADQLVLALKFGQQLAMAPLFAHLLRDALITGQASQQPLPDILLPVPLARERLLERGFNQALEITRPLGRALGIPWHAGVLLRTRNTAHQARLHVTARNRNVRAAFALAPGMQAHVEQRHVGLVDDVITTGATLNEIAALLKRYGASRVSNLVFARTPSRDG